MVQWLHIAYRIYNKVQTSYHVQGSSQSGHNLTFLSLKPPPSHLTVMLGLTLHSTGYASCSCAKRQP